MSSDQLLRVWEVLSGQRDPAPVLASVVEALAPAPPFDALGAVLFDRLRGKPFTLHLVGPERAIPVSPQPAGSWKAIPYSHSETERAINAGAPYECRDLESLGGWQPHELRLAAVGLHSYVAVGLKAKDELLGLLVVARYRAGSFSTDEVELFGELAKPVAASLAIAPGDLRGTLKSREREMIEAALQATGAKVAGPEGAAARLGMPASTLESRIKSLRIDKSRFRSPGKLADASAGPSVMAAGIGSDPAS